ncbi:MAG: LemA family protein [Treponema sp.]|nr:LemA family protein [Spirochaetia bacterium]MDD7014654.1 LemA family protein [Spirochaetales bacterium]MDY4902448.1 LemA family protein [Treponema sp.]
MKKILIVLGIIAVVLFGCYSCVAGKYNKMVELNENVVSKWADVEAQYQKRYDLVPNLVNTVKGYASHEESVYTQIAESRSKLGTTISLDSSQLDDEQAFENYQQAQNNFGATVSRLLSLTENYPELKANQNFLDLQSQLEGIENRISTERIRYNDAVKEYNTTISKFPATLFAGMFGFKTKAYFKSAQEAASAPQVEF